MTSAAREALRADEVLDLRAVIDAKLSPDGQQVVYAVSRISEDRREDRVQLCLVDVTSGQSRELTAPDALDRAPVWLPDGSAVVFRSTRSGTAQIHRVEIAGGELVQLSLNPLGVGTLGPLVSPSGQSIAFAAPTRTPRDPALPYRIKDAIWRLDGVGWLRDAETELHVMPASGGPARQLTSNRAVLVSAQWSPDAERLLHLSFREADEPSFELRICDVRDGSDQLVWSSRFYGYPPAASWLPDGRIVRTTDNRVVWHGEQPGIVVTDAAPDAAEDARTAGLEAWFFAILQGDSPHPGFATPRIVVTPDGSRAFAPAQNGGCIEVRSIPIADDGEQELVVSGPQASIPIDASDQSLLVATSTMQEPMDLWLVDHDGGFPRRLTRLNEDRFTPEQHFSVDHLEATAADGTPLEGWLLRPPGTRGPVPTILTNHGGPHAGWGHTFSHDFAMLADAGYATLLVNPRGSTGYAPEFATQLHGDWGNHDISDLECVLDAAIADGLVDPDALGTRGVSGGGYLTAWLVTHGSRFRAAVVESAALDWNAMLGADMGAEFQHWMSGGPLGREATYADREAFSPTSSAANCATPTLIIHHEQDLRTPLANADMFFSLLKAAGAEVEMLRMPTTSHDGSSDLGSPAIRVAENEALLEWFERFLR